MQRLNETQLAKRWGMTTRTLQLWRAKGKGPAFIRIGERSIFYREEDVLAYEKSNVVGKHIPPDGWELVVKRAAGALDLLSKKHGNKAAATLATLRDELRALITKQ